MLLPDVGERPHELLRLVLLRDLELTVTEAVAKDDNVLGESVILLPILDQALQEHHLERVADVLALESERCPRFGWIPAYAPSSTVKKRYPYLLSLLAVSYPA